MDNVDTLARTLYGEAEAGDREDATAIACVVMNRARHALWPADAAGVCLQPWQFSCWNQNDPNRERILKADPANPWFRTCRKIAEAAVAGRLADVTNGATHYHTDYIKKPGWAKGKKPCFVTAEGRYQHLFYNDIDTPPPATAKQALDQARPLSATRTVKGAQAAVIGGGVLAGLAPLVDHAAPIMGFVTNIAQTAPWLLASALVLGIGYMVWARMDDRNKGRR